MAWIECYVYSEGPATDTAIAALDTVQTFGLVKTATPSNHYARPAAPQRWTDLIATWATQLSTATGYTVTCTYSSTTKRLTVAANNLIRPLMVGNSALFTGFTQALAGSALSWTADDAPLGRVELLGALVEPREDWASVEMELYRHGRARATTWGNHQVHRCALYMVATSAAQFDAGYVQAGRVRLHQGESGAALSAYDETNPGGYVDGWVIGCGQPVEESENLWAYPMLIGVAR